MTRQEAKEQAKWLAAESKTLAAAFRPSANEGNTIRVPVAMCARLAELLELMSTVMVAVSEDQITGLTE